MALDNEKQPDYTLLIKDNDDWEKNIELFYKNVFRKLFYCLATKKQFKQVLFPLIGTASFSKFAPDPEKFNRAWLNAFKETLDEWKKHITHITHFYLLARDSESELRDQLSEIICPLTKSYWKGTQYTQCILPNVSIDNIDDFDTFMEAFKDESNSDRRRETLFVNSWDPHSMLGNGNKGDNSIDGRYGRATNISLVGWLPANPHMKFVPISEDLSVRKDPVAVSLNSYYS